MEEFRKRFWVSLALTIPILLLSEMIQEWFGFSISIPFQSIILLLLSAAIYLYGGWLFLKGASEELRKKEPGIMTLIATATSVAFFYSSGTIFLGGKEFFWELATLIDVMLLGHWVEARSVLGASRALEELVKIMPKTAHLVKKEGIFDVSVSELQPGNVVLIRPGEKIPSDGVVVEGESFVNESLLTGESKPIHKIPGSKVVGASINGMGMLKVRIEKVGEETYISQVIKLVKQAQESRSRTQDLANRAAGLLFYIAIIVGIITYLAWFLLGKADTALERSVTVLVIACPHALGLAIPVVVALSTSLTARSGILIRNRKAFEMVKDVDVVIFDKTGTLTTGSYGVTNVIHFVSEKELLKLTAAVEMNSEHIIGKAITEYARRKNIKFTSAKEFKALAGKGVYGRVGGREVYVGGPALLKEMGIELDDAKTKKIQEKGRTVVFTLVDGKLIGAFTLADKVRDESHEAVSKLKWMGIKVYMLTGDSEGVAKGVAEEIEVDEYFSEMLPEEKVEKINALRREGRRVAMVGDGVNDAPALAASDVGIAIGAGTDVAIESADIILVKNDPRDVIKVIEVSRKTYSKMLQNLWWAAGYNIVAIPLAAGVLYNYGITLSPAVGALLMSLSTVIVALNAQTLRKYEPKATAGHPAHRCEECH
ncbi:MAG: copper-translocating P-type ATPase [Candidatus Micrarchaeia archaeon]